MKWIALTISVFLVGCSTYQSKVSGPRQLIKEGNFSEAIDKLKPLADEQGRDQLVYLFDYATALQMAGRYKESVQSYLKADQLAEIVDYHSVSKITLAALGSEDMIQYKGENYEKTMLNVMTAMSFLAANDFENAVVQARRVNEKVNKIRLDGGREDFELNPFAFYLMGLLFEADGSYDNAYISFEKAYNLDGKNPILPADLIRTAKKSRRTELYQKWKSEFASFVTESPDWYDKKQGDVVVIFMQGWSPTKNFSPIDRRFPKLYMTPSLTRSARLEIQNPSVNVESKTAFSVADIAMQTLDADYSWMAARKVGAFIAKEVVADQIRQKNELLGFAAWITMHVSDHADLRQWSTLPETIQIIRTRMNPGTYNMSVRALDNVGSPTGEVWNGENVEVQSGKTKFIIWRALR